MNVNTPEGPVPAYYNEIDPFAAAWLRELIKHGHIADGEVDTRSVEDVCPSDLRGFVQCHFFAGIGVWSYALRRAGWPDDRPVWTGSCPCQPFSTAGKGAGFADERHLWPAFCHLIRQRRPRVVFGEQVASKDGLAWLDLVAADLEGEGYAIGAVDTCAAGFGAPHIRQRLYWVADASREQHYQPVVKRPGWRIELADCGAARGLADSMPAGRAERRARARRGQASGGFELSGLADSKCDGGRPDQPERGPEGRAADGRNPSGLFGDGRPRPTDGYWRDADWLFCRDGKWRPVGPGTFPLAHGAPARVGRLRGYGNAINASQAQGFIEAYLEVMGGAR